MSQPKWTLDRIISTLFYLGGIALFLVLIYTLSSYLIPFFLALLVAYILDPVVSFFQRKVFKNRVIAVFGTLIIGLLVFGSVVLLISPSAAAEWEASMELFRQYELATALDRLVPQSLVDMLTKAWSESEVSALFSEENIEKYGGDVWQAIMGIVDGTMGLIKGLLSFVAFVIYLVFAMIYFDELTHNWQSLVPRIYRDQVNRLAQDIEKQMKAYFRGQSLIVLFQCVFFAIGFKIIGLPLAIIFGVLVGLMNFIPYLQLFGVLPALLLGALQAAQEGSPYGWIVVKILLVFAVVQLIESTLLTPKIMGEVTGLNPAIILLALSIWGGLFGLVGMIVALPFTSLLISYYKIFVSERP